MEKSPHPSSPSSSPNSSSSNNGANAAAAANFPPTLPPLTPKSPIPNPYPTTFVQADTRSFKQVVQMLTGSAETAAKRAAAAAAAAGQAHNPSMKNHPIPPLNRAKKPAFKLYERRPSMKNLKMIGPLVPSFVVGSINQNSPAAMRSPLSPSILDFPSLALSPVTPLDMAAAATTPEERAIAEKGYYLHPSPRPATPRGSEPPRLLPLFPVTTSLQTDSA